MRSAQELEQTKGLRQEIRQSFLFWCEMVLKPRGLKPARHHIHLINFLQELATDPDFDRAMVFMPPGYAKTEYVSILFPAWFLSLYPDEAVIAASNTQDLAERNGRRVRNLIAEYQDDLGYGLSADSQAAGRWGTNKEGEYYAAGVSGTIIGRRAALAIIDDPVASRAQVENLANRDIMHDWYKASVIGRMKPYGKIVVMHTRWHLDDLAGRLLKEEVTGGDKWRVLSLPALALESDPMGRAVGEALWPEWENEAKLLRKKNTVGPREWSSQYMQNPVNQEGNLFLVNNIQREKSIPSPLVQVRRSWDLAATEQTGGRNPDWTVGIKIGIMEDKRTIILDEVRIQGTPNQVEALMLRTAKADGHDVPIEIPQDPAQAGKWQIGYLSRVLLGYIVHPNPITKDKSTAAMPFASQVEANNVVILDRAWTDNYLEELKAFPNGEKDDRVDATTLGFNSMVQTTDNAGIMEYYAERAAQNSGARDGRSRPSNLGHNGGPPIEEDEYGEAYRAAYSKAMGGSDARICKYCKQPVTGAMVSDGEFTWHPEHYS